ncbi:MAG: hypothetical protein QM784_09145 [Polyangiaceae bacterium]
MTKLQRWTAELPENSSERELLAAGKRALPPAGSREAGWRALNVALGATSVTLAASKAAALTTGTAQSSVATAASAGAAQASVAMAPLATTGAAVAPIATGTTIGVLGVAVIVKPIAIGFAIGMGLLGVTTAVNRTTESTTESTTRQSKHVERVATRAPSSASTWTGATNAPSTLDAAKAADAVDGVTMAAPRTGPTNVGGAVDGATTAAPQLGATDTSEFVETGARSGAPVGVEGVPTSRSRRSLRTDTNLSNDERAEPKSSNEESAPRFATLAEQARELARIKRLLDASAADEALHRLEVDFARNVHSGLAEERDALYVRAMEKAGRLAEARVLAQRFLRRFPSSAHAEQMHKLAFAE